ncbi:MAG: methionine synthase [Pseudanabaenales cyanobacterium]|nr:methionine synthase [Pseudanabaenales cyanobacterium]
MSRGIYIVANDKVADNAIALLSSLRLSDPEIPVVLIPFNNAYQKVASTLAGLYQVECFPDLAFLEDFTQTIGEIFPRDFLALPNKMRKLVAWFGPLDDFLYIDTDILVFEPISKTLDYLSQSDFLCCDYHYKGRGLQDVFSPLIQAQGIFSQDELTDVFNSGFWGSKKEAISLEQMYSLLRECAQHREYFDFSSGTTDQPIMNFLVLKSIPKRLNITQVNPGEPGSWAGSQHFREENHILYDRDRALRYLHWAGTPMRPGGPYRPLWEYYRYLNDPRPASVSKANPNPSVWRKLIRSLRRRV